MSVHDLYVAAAYGITIAVLAVLVGVLLIDKRARQRELAELEKQGLRRRSDREAQR